MGILSAILGNASSADLKDVEARVERALAPEESVEAAFRLVRDLVVLTNRRLLLVDKEGITGKRSTWLSVPYGGITRYAVSTAGHLDLDSELLVWTMGDSAPLKVEFRRGEDVWVACRIVATHVR